MAIHLWFLFISVIYAPWAWARIASPSSVTEAANRHHATRVRRGIVPSIYAALSEQGEPPPQRQILWLSSTSREGVKDRDGDWHYPTESVLFIQGTEAEPPLNIFFERNQPIGASGETTIDIVARTSGPGYEDEVAICNPRWRVRSHYIGYTTLANTVFADPVDGRGIVAQAWGQTFYNSVDGFDTNWFVYDLLKDYLGVSPMSSALFDGWILAVESNDFWRVRGMRSYPCQLRVSTPTSNRLFDIQQDSKNPRLISTVISPWDQPTLRIAQKFPSQNAPSLAATRRLPPIPEAVDEGSISTDPLAAGDAFPNVCPREAEGQCRTPLLRGSVPELPPGSVAQMAYARIAGFLSNIVVVTGAAAAVAGLGLLLSQPAVIILDFQEGNPVGGAFATTSLVLGAAALAFGATPIGLLLGGLAIFFAILPVLFEHAQAQLPAARNATQIIQYAMFGDINHTGNEKCRQGGNPNCTALYGPGVLSSAFRWDNFDPVAFLIQFNDGYPISIPDIASSFYIVNRAIKSDGDDQMATITCDKGDGCNRFGCDTDWLRHCKNPTFAIRKERITIPVLNQTADQVHDRIIPKPGGDCKLVTDLASRMYRSTNITQTGAPVAIACNITASLDVNGSAVPVDGAGIGGEGSAALHSPANASTDDTVHADAAPWPATGFANVLNASNAVCLDAVCLPNGTYTAHGGDQGIDAGSTSRLTIPPGARMVFTIVRNTPTQRMASAATITYTTNMTLADHLFWTEMKELAQGETIGGDARTFDLIIPGSVPAVLCLFTQPEYRGKVACFGPGSGNVTSDMMDQAQSLIPHGGVIAWAYGIQYGDGASLYITDAIADLAAKPLGDTDTFSQAIKALWVRGPDAPQDGGPSPKGSVTLPSLQGNSSTSIDGPQFDVSAITINNTTPLLVGDITCANNSSSTYSTAMAAYCTYLQNGTLPTDDWPAQNSSLANRAVAKSVGNEDDHIHDC